MTTKVIPPPYVLLLLLLLLLLLILFVEFLEMSYFRKNYKNPTEHEIDGNRQTQPREAEKACPTYFKSVFNNDRTRDRSPPPTLPRLQGAYVHQICWTLMAFLLSSLSVVRGF